EGLVSAPVTWDEIDSVDPHDFSIATMGERFARIGDLHADIDAHPYAIDTLLEWADRDEHDSDVHPAEPEA
ncbi:MAG TPA: ATP-dependent DNA ligase, partial [Friedmanniella sp.]